MKEKEQKKDKQQKEVKPVSKPMALILTIVTVFAFAAACFSLGFCSGKKVNESYAAATDSRYYYVNKIVDLPSSAKGSSFSFSSRGQSFNYIRFSATNGLQYMTNGSSSSEAETVVVYTSANGWVNELYRYIYVSDITGQDTPSYLLSNALETIAPVLYVGTYTWVDNPSSGSPSNFYFYFSSADTAFQQVRIFADGGLVYKNLSGSNVNVYSPTPSIGWSKETYKKIYINEAVSNVSESFYNRFLSNIASFSTVDEPTTHTIEAGTYQARDVLTSVPFPMEHFAFSSNGIANIGMEGVASTYYTLRYYQTEDDYINAYGQGGWLNQNLKTITVDSPQSVGETFYYWFEANYQPYEITSYTITYNLTNATKGTSAPTEITSDGEVEITISAESGYSFVENPTATNATAQWNGDQKSGVLTITEPTNNVTVTATATKETPEEYSATITATATGSNANKIEAISPSTLTLTSGETQKIVVGITDNAYTITQLNYETGISASFTGNVITVTADTLTENKTINLQISAGLNEASNEQYQAGYDDGEKAGYQSGVKDGEETGYNNGYTAGLEDGKANATIGQQLTYITQIKDSKIDITDITPYLDSTKTTLNLGTIPGINSDDSYTAIKFTVNSDLIESDNINFTINWYNGGIVSGTNGFNTTFRAYATYTNTGVKSFDFKSVNDIYTITLPKTYNGESDTIKDFYFTLEKPMPTDIVIVSKSTEFTNGYNSGYTNGMEQGKETGYQQGKEEGLTEGKTQGYQDGYNKGIEEGASLNGLILSIAQVPIDFITNCFNVTILGINIAGLITGFITAAVVIWILKKLL